MLRIKQATDGAQWPSIAEKIKLGELPGETPMNTCRIFIRLAIVACMIFLGACAAGGDVSKPIPAEYLSAQQPATRVVVVLPGRGDDLASLKRRDIATIIRKAWPDSDVILTGLTMPFYRQGRASSRLHDEIIEPARQRGYTEVWLVGISLGGMGAILYEHDYPGDASGILLLSPYLGEAALQDEIRAAGGLANWTPGPRQTLGPDTFERELWRTLKQWQEDPVRARAIWLGYGTEEPFRVPIALMLPALPTGHVLPMPGRHDWNLWIPAASALLERAAGSRAQEH